MSVYIEPHNQENALNKKRVLTVDILRGVALIAAVAIYSLPKTAAVLPIFTLSEGYSLSFADVIFPAFAFLMGFSAYFKLVGEQSKKGKVKWVTIRFILLYLIGGLLSLALNQVFTWEVVFCSNIQLLAIAGLLVSLVLIFIGQNILLWFIALLLLIHSVLEVMSDMLVHKVVFVSLGLIAVTLLGAMAGNLFYSSNSAEQRVQRLSILGVITLVLGLMWNAISPIFPLFCNSSFVLVSVGAIALSCALVEWIVSIKKIRFWAPFFAIIGKNPLVVTVIISIIIAAMRAITIKTVMGALTLENVIYNNVNALYGAEWLNLLITMSFLGLAWVACYLLNKKNIINLQIKKQEYA